MKKLLLSISAVIILLGFSTYADAWHVEYNNSGDMDVIAAPDSFFLSANVFETYDAEWSVEDTTQANDGSISVTYDVCPGGGISQNQTANIQFQIVSDHGNLNHVPIMATIRGEAEAYVDVIINSLHGETLDGMSSVQIGLPNDFGGTNPDFYVSASAWTEGSDDNYAVIDENIQLLANTWYHLDASFFTDIYATVLEENLPASFASLADFNDYFPSGAEYGQITASVDAWLEYSLEIDQTETPVPVPSSVLLLFSGLFGLVAVRRKKRK